MSFPEPPPPPVVTAAEIEAFLAFMHGLFALEGL